MNEGEFKKRINLKKEWRAFRRWIKVWQVDDILHEACKDFYERYCSHCLNKDMFSSCPESCPIMKWFGTEEKKRT